MMGVPIVYGFTGTREGLTLPQRAALAFYLKHHPAAELHQGCCIGADEEVTEVVEAAKINFGIPCPLIGWPSNLPGMTSTSAQLRCRDIHDPAPPLDRNRLIVHMADVLLACPRGPEDQRSGTWYTVRHARRVGCPVVFFWPDGSTTTEGFA